MATGRMSWLLAMSSGLTNRLGNRAQGSALIMRSVSERGGDRAVNDRVLRGRAFAPHRDEPRKAVLVLVLDEVNRVFALGAGRPPGVTLEGGFFPE